MTNTLPLAGAVTEVLDTLTDLIRRIESADTTEPTVSPERLLLLAGPLLSLLGGIDQEARRLTAWLPPGRATEARGSRS